MSILAKLRKCGAELHEQILLRAKSQKIAWGISKREMQWSQPILLLVGTTPVLFQHLYCTWVFAPNREAQKEFMHKTTTPICAWMVIFFSICAWHIFQLELIRLKRSEKRMDLILLEAGKSEETPLLLVDVKESYGTLTENEKNSSKSDADLEIKIPQPAFGVTPFQLYIALFGFMLLVALAIVAIELWRNTA
ncbi:hypothetical protein EG329_006127 [Mollisiaceae sp. DMI_Dod_QoI]|nr:hypothetical protein EG329_006127 [Helotiales sp. DMI_Dod_QoI]